MVTLDFITTTACPVCGCQVVVSESVEVERFGDRTIRRHCNGGKWEYREFACGCRVHYCPNFMKEEIVQKCAFDPDEAALKEKQNTLKMSIVQQIEAGDCPDNYKTRLKQLLEYV